MVKVSTSCLKFKTSDWILQEIGFAVSRDMQILLLQESGLRNPGGKRPRLPYIGFRTQKPHSGPRNNDSVSKIPKRIPQVRNLG